MAALKLFFFFGHCWVHGRLSGEAFLDLKKNSGLKRRGPKETVFCNGGNMAYVEGWFLRFLRSTR